MGDAWQAWSGLAIHQQLLAAGFVASIFALLQPFRWVAVWILCAVVLGWVVS